MMAYLIQKHTSNVELVIYEKNPDQGVCRLVCSCDGFN